MPPLGAAPPSDDNERARYDTLPTSLPAQLVTTSLWHLERLMLAIRRNRANDVFLLCLFKKRCLETAGAYLFTNSQSR